MIRSMFAAAAAVSLAVTAPASAAQYNRISVGDLAAILQNAGLSYGVTSKSDIIQVGGSFIWLTDCGSDGKCAEIAFFRNYNDVYPTLQAVNQWNNERKIPEASVNGNGTLHMEMWISAIGVTDQAIIDNFAWFEKYVADTDFWGPYIRSSS